MIADLKPYSTYKRSGVPWLGEVPAHWTLRRTKTLLHERSEKGFPDEPLLAATQTKGVVRKEQYENRTVLALKDLHLLKLVRVGDFVISLRSFQGGIEYAREQGIISPAYTILYPVQRNNHAYLTHVFKAKPYIEHLSLFVTGIRQGQNIDYQKLARSLLPYPPPPEQAAIVRFLDHADRRIRRNIHAKQKLITLLEEQKQALIHQAVTRGIDPNVRLKPSDVEWLGDVPVHWERRAVWQLFQIGRGKVTSHEYIANHSGSFPLYSSQTANDGVMGHIDTFMFDGDFLTWTTDGAHAGTVFRRSGKFNCTNVCGTLFPKTQLDLDFMRMAIASETKRQVRLDINPKLMNNMMARIRVSVPPYDEQVRITKHVQEIFKPSDSVIERAQLQVGFLREYRTRLIADLVTGKLDVREAAARLPEVDPLADEFNALTTQATETGVMELEDANESPEELTMENEVII